MTHMMLLWRRLGENEGDGGHGELNTEERRQRGEEEQDDRTEDSGKGSSTKGKDFASESCGREKTGQREEAAGRNEGRAAKDNRPRRGVAFGAQKASV